MNLIKLSGIMTDHELKNEGRISIEQYNRELEEAEERVNSGEFYTQQEVEEMSRKWQNQIIQAE